MNEPEGEYDGDDHDESFGGTDPAGCEDFGNEITPARTTPIESVINTFFSDIYDGLSPVRWPLGEGWETFSFRPHEVSVIGGAAGRGKTALCLNLIWRAMQLTPSLRVLIANNESGTPRLLERMTAMIAGINLRHVQNRDREHCTAENLANVKAAFQAVAGRLEFVEMPFTLEQVIDRAMQFRADVVLLDTLQKARLAGFDGEAGDRISRTMPMLRDLANQGRCVLAAAQLSREGTKHMKFRAGSKTHDDVDLAAFYGHSEIESSTDNAFLLVCDKNTRFQQQAGEGEYLPVPMELRDAKGRDREMCNIPLLFDGRYQRFTVRQSDVAAAGGKAQPTTQSKKPTKATAGSAVRKKSLHGPAERHSSANFTTDGGAHEDHEWFD